eukprot:10068100-Alexandrium_andersonii.AAC.1
MGMPQEGGDRDWPRSHLESGGQDPLRGRPVGACLVGQERAEGTSTHLRRWRKQHRRAPLMINNYGAIRAECNI